MINENYLQKIIQIMQHKYLSDIEIYLEIAEICSRTLLITRMAAVYLTGSENKRYTVKLEQSA